MVEVIREVHVEHLIGRRVHDRDGRVVGRIEEMRVEIVDGDPVITEFHLGAAALLERVGGFFLQLPFLSRIPRSPRLRKIGWRDLDLSDPLHPRTSRATHELEHVRPG